MTQRLLVLIGEDWPRIPSARWVLVDATERVLQEGESEPRHWPAAKECEVVLAGAQCTWIEVGLPRAARQEQARLVSYAVEDRLLKEPDSQHLTLTHRDTTPEGQQAGVLVVDRARLRAVLAQLAAIGRAPVRMVAELETAPAARPGWSLNLGPAGGVILKTGPRHALAVDRDMLADVLTHALLQARARGEEPGKIELHAAAGIEADPAWQHLPLPLAQGAPYQWWAEASRGTDLLHDEFAPAQRRSGWMGALRRPALVAGAAGVVFFTGNLADIAWQRYDLAKLEERMQRLFETAVPNTPAVAPAAQLQRQLDVARAQHGLLRRDDFLSELHAYAEARGAAATGSIRGLRYEAGTLELQLEPAPAGELEALRQRLSVLGYEAAYTADTPPVFKLTPSPQQ